MGIYPSVLMENTGLWDPRTSESLAEALRKTKRRFGLDGLTERDDFLVDLLRRRLLMVKQRTAQLLSLQSLIGRHTGQYRGIDGVRVVLV